MKKILCIIVTTVMGQAAFASILPSQVTDGRSFTVAFGANEKIQNYIRGRSDATPDLFVEIQRFAEQMDSRQIGLNDKATELLSLAEEVGSQINKLDSKTREELLPITASLLSRYSARLKNQILLRLVNRFWLWSPENIDYMARMVRNDSSHIIATQLLWVMERSTPEQRRWFFSQVPGRQPNKLIRWFPHALAYKYGHSIEMIDLRASLRAVNPEKLRPQANPVVLNGVTLATTADLYSETMSLLKDQLPGKTCAAKMISVSLVE